jgi:hypothetical protein
MPCPGNMSCCCLHSKSGGLDRRSAGYWHIRFCRYVTSALIDPTLLLASFVAFFLPLGSWYFSLTFLFEVISIFDRDIIFPDEMKLRPHLHVRQSRSAFAEGNARWTNLDLDPVPRHRRQWGPSSFIGMSFSLHNSNSSHSYQSVLIQTTISILDLRRLQRSHLAIR